MSLRSLASKLNSDAAADELVDYIYNDTTGLFGSEDAYLEKYFDEKVRKSIFGGGICPGGVVNLSNRANLLKAAFQRRYASMNQFQPVTAYHVTTDLTIGGMIASEGFRLAGETLYGKGVYFFDNSNKADKYVAQGSEASSADDNPTIVIEVTLFTNPMDYGKPPGYDWLMYKHFMVMVMKNPLVIFPKHVYSQGKKHPVLKHDWLPGKPGQSHGPLGIN